jgi:excinuclease ABC subunit C
MDIQHQLHTLPTTPGVYLFKDAKGNVLYVGKAKSLRSRVRSYFREGADLDPAKAQMVKKVADLQTITTDTETEALVLEANLIRKHQPPYNVVLRDDKY